MTVIVFKPNGEIAINKPKNIKAIKVTIVTSSPHGCETKTIDMK